MYNYEKESRYDREYCPICEEEGHCNGNCHCHNGKDKGACVEEILEAILKAQRKVEKEHVKKCSSCDEWYEEQLEEPKKFNKNTIPIILYCGCEPFKGEGVVACPGGLKDKKFLCITSFIFKIRDLKGSCAELELLTFKPKKDRCNNFKSPCDQINHQYVNDLMKTGSCIIVDLSCFCGVSTLPAVRL